MKIKNASILTLMLSMAVSLPANAMSEREYQERLCSGMIVEWHLPSGGRADCLSATHAIEVDFSGKWQQAIGQSLYYASETRLKPGIILICRKSYQTCLRHAYRLEATIARWQLPITVWQCGPTGETLDECLMKTSFETALKN